VGSHIAVGDESGVIRVYDLVSLDISTTRTLKQSIVRELVYSPNSQQLAILTYRNTIDLLDLWTEKPIVKLSGHSWGVATIAYSPCGDWIVSGGSDKTTRLWRRRSGDAEDWICVSVIQGFSKVVESVAWNPIFPLEFVTITYGRTLQVWNISLSDSPGSTRVNLLWRSDTTELYTKYAIISGAIGLSPTNRKLLLQGGAVDESPVQGETREGGSEIND